MNIQRIAVPAFAFVMSGAAVLIALGYFSSVNNRPSSIVYEKTDTTIAVEHPVVADPPKEVVATTTPTSAPDVHVEDLEDYTGPVRHIFFHSLIIYPEKALADAKNIAGYKDNMVTVLQFKQILEQLYAHGFVLIDTNLLFSFDEKGKMQRNVLRLPKGKRPLILSIDDVSYYSYMKNGGFARRLVVEDDIVKTEVITPEGKTVVTDDGDVMPIVDSFVKDHPDFSFNGAKGIIALTGFEGILGYRTNLKGERGDSERKDVAPVVAALEKSGWTFASHSYSHNQVFLRGTITADFLANDIDRWAKEVEPLVGRTNIFIGPFGQVFSEDDPRRKLLLDAGFSVLYGVGMDGYMKFFGNHLVMNRANIDGYRLTHNPKKLHDLFGIAVTADFK